MTHANRNATIHVFIGPSAASTVTRAVAHLEDQEGFSHQPVLVPSTGRTEDPLITRVDQALHECGAHARWIVPVAGVRSLVSGAWKEVRLQLPDLPNRRVRIANELIDAEPWVVCDVDAVARTGPFVLDVFSGYLHPWDRLSQFAHRDRARRSAEVNLTVRPKWCLIGGHAESGYLIATAQDVIAAELFALSLSEYALGPHVAVTGPWEDPVVQRATELQLGVVVPEQIEFVVHGEPGGARNLIRRIAGRIGVSL